MSPSNGVCFVVILCDGVMCDGVILETTCSREESNPNDDEI